MTLPIPVYRYLVPEPGYLIPAGFALVDERIAGGLPHTIAIGQDLKLIVAVPNGLAMTWRDVDPTTLVSSSGLQVEPWTPKPAEPVGTVERPPARILMRQGSSILASVPLVAGLQRVIPDGGGSDIGGQIELLIVSWDIRAGSLRGPGDFGSRISLAWKRADEAIAEYSTPPVNLHLKPRLDPALRMESKLGLKGLVKLQRFNIKKVMR